MILITLLLVLTIERIAATTEIWQFSFYYKKYFSLWTKRLFSENGAQKLLENRLARWSFLLLPALLVWMISSSIDWILIDLVFNVLVLLICIGCVSKRKIYKQFLNAANRGDEQACHLYAMQLRQYESNPPPMYDDEVKHDEAKHDETGQPSADETKEEIDTEAATEQEQIAEPETTELETTELEAEQQINQEAEQQPNCDVEGHSLGLTLVWFNFKYYCAVLFWFVCAGPAGAVLYCMMREAFDDRNGLVTLKETASIKRWLHVLDWIPARVCSAGYLLIGDFTRSSGIWLGYLLDFKSPAKNLVCDIAQAAETVEMQHDNKILEPVCMLKLAKRNILFFLAMVAVLTLYGGIA